MKYLRQYMKILMDFDQVKFIKSNDYNISVKDQCIKERSKYYFEKLLNKSFEENIF